MNQFNHIDPQSLRAFYFAAYFENFTKAAREAHLTQSGVSQHVAYLEELLKVSLFMRAGKKVKLTQAGIELKTYAEKYFEGVSELMDKMGQVSHQLSGKVSYAMPASCLKTPHFPMLLRARKSFSKIDLKVEICHSQEVLDKLVAGVIDFGFMTESIPHKDVDQVEFAREEYVLVGADKKNITDIDLKSIAKIPFVNYPGVETLFNSWAKERGLRNSHFHELSFAGEINDLNAAITMCIYGVGYSIFPKHCVQEFIDEKKLFTPKSLNSGKEKNPIFLVKLKNKQVLGRVSRVIDEFIQMKKL